MSSFLLPISMEGEILLPSKAALRFSRETKDILRLKYEQNWFWVLDNSGPLESRLIGPCYGNVYIYYFKLWLKARALEHV